MHLTLLRPQPRSATEFMLLCVEIVLASNKYLVKFTTEYKKEQKYFLDLIISANKTRELDCRSTTLLSQSHICQKLTICQICKQHQDKTDIKNILYLQIWFKICWLSSAVLTLQYFIIHNLKYNNLNIFWCNIIYCTHTSYSLIQNIGIVFVFYWSVLVWMNKLALTNLAFNMVISMCVVTFDW